MNGIGSGTSTYKRPMSELLELFVDQDATQDLRDQTQARLDEARKVDLENATVVIASWENRLAAAGGVKAVTQAYAEHLACQDRRVLVVTPLHTGLRIPPGAVRPRAVVWLDFEEERRRVEVFEAEWGKVKWIYLHCEGFFTAEGGRDGSNPYLYKFDAVEESAGRGSPRLVRDCLFFAASLPRVLCALGLSDNVVLHLQDWESAAAALTVKEAILRKEIKRAICVLALHNPYDKDLSPGAPSKGGWGYLTARPEPASSPSTFLHRMLPLLDAPPATVSREFAVDLVSDPLQTTHLADHLQADFRRFGILGVDNGPFETLTPPFSPEAIEAAQAGRPAQILREKVELREKMKAKLKAYRPRAMWGHVDFENLADDVPVFMCVGRLDPGQKGFDVASRAIESLLETPGFKACFVLTSMVGDAPQEFVDDLQTLAGTYPEHVVVYPLRMEQGYSQTQAGCTFSLWPSMYEPFGAVSEFLLRGTPVVARATGGLRQQVVNFDRKTGNGNGVLYHSPTSKPGASDWRLLQRELNPRNRMNYRIYREQVNELAVAIRTAVDVFKDPVAYGRLLSNVHDSVAGYSWARAEKEYASLYEIATR